MLNNLMTFAYAADEVSRNVFVVNPPAGQVENYISGRPVTVNRHAADRPAAEFVFWVWRGLPARRGRGVVLGLGGVLLCPGAEQDGVTAARLGHHELRQTLGTRVDGQAVHLQNEHQNTLRII